MEMIISPALPTDPCPRFFLQTFPAHSFLAVSLAQLFRRIRARNVSRPNKKPTRLASGLKILFRSEERRVGKECRSRWARGHGEKKRDSGKRGVCRAGRGTRAGGWRGVL